MNMPRFRGDITEVCGASAATGNVIAVPDAIERVRQGWRTMPRSDSAMSRIGSGYAARSASGGIDSMELIMPANPVPTCQEAW